MPDQNCQHNEKAGRRTRLCYSTHTRMGTAEKLEWKL